MYEKDKRTRVTLRLSDKQMAFVTEQTKVLGITPSDYLRMLVNGVMYVNENGINEQEQELIKETLGRENDKAHINN